MSTVKVDWQPESEDLARAKDMVRRSSEIGTGSRGMNCSPLMSFFPSACRRSGRRPTSCRRRVAGRGSGKRRALTQAHLSQYQERPLHHYRRSSADTDAILLGNITPPSTKEGESGKASPIIIYMDFNSEGEISIMTIAAIDLQPLADQIRCAALNGALKAA